MTEFEQMVLSKLSDTSTRLAVFENIDRPSNACQTYYDGIYRQKENCETAHRDMHATMVDRSSAKVYTVVAISMLINVAITIINLVA